MYKGAFGHFGLRKRFSIRDSLRRCFPMPLGEFYVATLITNYQLLKQPEVIPETAPTAIQTIRVAT